MSQSRRFLEAAASRCTEQAFRRDLLPNLTVVNEYPKSGGTWVAKMIGSLLDCPFVDNQVHVPRAKAVMRTHWDPSGLPAGVYVQRDGRDVMVSLFHHRCRRMEQDPRVAATVNRVYPFTLDPSRIEDQLPAFIEVEMTTRTAGSPLSWPAHVTAALANPRLAVVRYEDLRSDPLSSLACLAEELLPEARISEGRVAAVVALHDRANTLGATHRMGNSSLRSARVGEWADVFSAEAVTVFDRHCGAALARAGYSRAAE